ncbi:hypothetical protein HRG_003025 [Hirsutella rhossiliensis]|uniref:Uncharacterized protein n=1 Tax=Hirsutella rhossiliensis TaxID=111463 RepID=A0A9P8N368_9HYPO|nr:uncharacterized protein HRG_03025 [Hirsutella rhossiliensis]KAH0965009.1 hypothetical protein HRG_03025 [Hirsutella rhossiliensis]
MMYPAYGGLAPDILPMSHPHDAFFDHPSTQMAISQPARRSSRSTIGQQRSGSAMRVNKPSSANNSPRSSTSANRRRTMMVDCSTPYRQRQVMDYFGVTHGNDVAMPTKQTARPLSWHPTSYMHQAQSLRQHHTSYPLPASNTYIDARDQHSTHQPHFSPAMASYSNDTSPCSTFSPLPLFPGYDDSTNVQADAWDFSQRATPFYPSSMDGRSMPDQFHALGGAMDQRMAVGGAADWEAFIMQRYDNTSPPTPETFPQMQHSQPAVSEGNLAYEALDKAEEEGEILVGMGLYDAPDKLEEDPQLNNYRSTVSSLLGSSFRPHEPRGKGLKLEETWEPPKSDDGEEDDDDDDTEETQSNDD